jgi:hypothetical protein
MMISLGTGYTLSTAMERRRPATDGVVQILRELYQCVSIPAVPTLWRSVY